MSKIFTENFFVPCQKYLQVHVDLENFFDSCQNYLQVPVEPSLPPPRRATATPGIPHTIVGTEESWIVP